jgi:hypothetical protein
VGEQENPADQVWSAETSRMLSDFNLYLSKLNHIIFLLPLEKGQLSGEELTLVLRPSVGKRLFTMLVHGLNLVRGVVRVQKLEDSGKGPPEALIPSILQAKVKCFKVPVFTYIYIYIYIYICLYAHIYVYMHMIYTCMHTMYVYIYTGINT